MADVKYFFSIVCIHGQSLVDDIVSISKILTVIDIFNAVDKIILIIDNNFKLLKCKKIKIVCFCLFSVPYSFNMKKIFKSSAIVRKIPIST